MKCSICGSEKLFETSIVYYLTSDGDRVNQLVRSFACEECGHVELFVPQETIDKHRESIRIAKERDAKVAEINEKIHNVEEAIKKLEAIICDENQTVKAVKEAQIKLPELQEKLRELGYNLGIAKQIGHTGSMLGG